jgi:diaminopropionate ammonia-lyase
MARFLISPNAREAPDITPHEGDPRSLHRRMPGYVPGPLLSMRQIAEELGIEALWVKDESSRFGLPAFKILGASWATYCALSDRLGRSPEPWDTVDELVERFAPLRPLTLVTATDGNHGRAVAHMARLLRLDAHILVPHGTAQARVDAIAGEGARVTVVNGHYDDAVRQAAAMADDEHLVVSDTSWEGYTEIPRRVIEGYDTIFAEADEVLETSGSPQPNLVLVQVGVGALAAAVVAHYASMSPPPRIVGFEPETAACGFASAEAGRMVSTPGPHTSMMVGMNCGTLSVVAWPALRDGIDAWVALDDEPAAAAMRMLATEGIVAGETGASGLAALLELVRHPDAASVRAALNIGPGTRALVISTEGATDPGAYARIVGRTPAEVTAAMEG